MTKTIFDWHQVDLIIENSLQEDLGSGDITTNLLLPEDSKSQAIIKAKQHGIVAGLPIAKRIFKRLDKKIVWIEKKRDGEEIMINDILAEIKGSKKAILTGERVALNFLQRLSGIATLTSKFVKAVEGLPAVITDTRKTVPGLRILDKYAVRVGGGKNHRMGLFDGILIKDNHIKIAGSISNALETIRKRTSKTYKLEVETSTLNQVKEVLSLGADIIMVDNMTIPNIKRAVELIKDRSIVEASGGITINNVRKVAETGVNLISIGSLTHSPKALDIGLYLV